MDKEAPPEIVYRSGDDRRRGLAVWREMARDLWCTRELIHRLAQRDISVRYRQSLLGYAWALVVPLITVGFFTYLVSHRVLPIGETALPYPVYALSGVVLWQLFAGILAASTGSLANAGSLVTKASFPKEALIFGSVGQPMVDFAIKLIVVAVVFVIYDVVPSSAALWVIGIVPLIILLAMGFGFLFAVANLVIRDVGNLVGMVATFGLFAAPVLYPPPTSEPFFLINILNPFSPLLIATQDLLGEGILTQPRLLLAGGLFAVLIFLFGWRVFRLVMRRVTERA